MNQEKIGKFIASLRKDNNLTQEKLAEKLGVSKNAVSKWERGLCLMDMSLLKPLSEILSVTVNDILAGEIIDDMKYKEKTEENIIGIFDEVKKYQKKQKIIILVILIPLIIFFSYAIVVYVSRMSLPVKYDMRIMKCSIKDDKLRFTVNGLSVIGTYFTMRELNNEKIYFFSADMMMLNKVRSHWETWDSMAKLLNGQKATFASFHEIDINPREHFKVYYTDVNLKTIEKLDAKKLDEIIKKESYLICEN